MEIQFTENSAYKVDKESFFPQKSFYYQQSHHFCFQICLITKIYSSFSLTLFSSFLHVTASESGSYSSLIHLCLLTVLLLSPNPALCLLLFL